MDFWLGSHLPLQIWRGVISSYRYLGGHLSEESSWSNITFSLVRKANQHLHFLRWLKCAGLGSSGITLPCRCVVEHILCSSTTAWHGRCWEKDMHKVIKASQRTSRVSLPYTSRCRERATSTRMDLAQPAPTVFVPLPSGKRLRSIKSRTTSLRNRFWKEAVRLLNSGGAVLIKAPLQMQPFIYLFVIIINYL